MRTSSSAFSIASYGQPDTNINDHNFRGRSPIPVRPRVQIQFSLHYMFLASRGTLDSSPGRIASAIRPFLFLHPFRPPATSLRLFMECGGSTPPFQNSTPPLPPHGRRPAHPNHPHPPRTPPSSRLLPQGLPEICLIRTAQYRHSFGRSSTIPSAWPLNRPRIVGSTFTTRCVSRPTGPP